MYRVSDSADAVRMKNQIWRPEKGFDRIRNRIAIMDRMARSMAGTVPNRHASAQERNAAHPAAAKGANLSIPTSPLNVDKFH